LYVSGHFTATPEANWTSPNTVDTKELPLIQFKLNWASPVLVDHYKSKAGTTAQRKKRVGYPQRD